MLHEQGPGWCWEKPGVRMTMFAGSESAAERKSCPMLITKYRT